LQTYKYWERWSRPIWICYQRFGWQRLSQLNLSLNGNDPVTSVNSKGYVESAIFDTYGDVSDIYAPRIACPAPETIMLYNPSAVSFDRHQYEYNKWFMLWRMLVESWAWGRWIFEIPLSFLIIALCSDLLPELKEIEVVISDDNYTNVIFWALVASVLVLGAFVGWQVLAGSGTAIEASVFDRLSQATSQVSLQEARIIRQRCEIVDLTEVIDGLETALEESHAEIEAMQGLLDYLASL
jgi:hypothetical protein